MAEFGVPGAFGLNGKYYNSCVPLSRRRLVLSALAVPLLAEGSADLYPRLGPMSEWDIAAGHAVLVAAGGTMRKLDGGALRYGQGNFLVRGFIATGDVTPVV